MTSSQAFTWPGTGKKVRRTFTANFKRELVEQTLAPGASISGIALANGLNANQLFAWRRKLLPQATAPSHAVLLPVRLKAPLRPMIKEKCRRRQCRHGISVLAISK
jgi:transposase